MPTWAGRGGVDCQAKVRRHRFSDGVAPWHDGSSAHSLCWLLLLSASRFSAVGFLSPRRSPRPPYQTRHTYACWNLTARGNLAFIANQMGHNDYSMLVKVYGRSIDSDSPRELERIWEDMQNMVKNVPNLSQKLAA